AAQFLRRTLQNENRHSGLSRGERGAQRRVAAADHDDAWRSHLAHPRSMLATDGSGWIHSARTSIPKPGASEGMIRPFCGTAVPAILFVSSNGTPGSERRKYSASGDSGMAMAACWPNGVFAPVCGMVTTPKDSA